MSSEVYYRSWMDKPHLDPNTNLLTEEYVQGIGEFMRLVQQQPDAKSDRVYEFPVVGSELVVFDVIFLVAGLPSLSLPLASLVVLPLAMFATPGLDSVFLRICYVDLKSCFLSQAWALVFRWLASILSPSSCFSPSFAFLDIGSSYLLAGGCAYGALGMCFPVLW
ncbi:hypothetical protein F2Q69_00050632 [Brassica cretica]|uniref:Uncharacterized protein n=1 Tax=Brassica cretica TaxID=69181 RepID=A0A8S9PMW7_BRACR|nr:hypothetical protein F2Q69_00050632 [Brassica cretica]